MADIDMSLSEIISKKKIGNANRIRANKGAAQPVKLVRKPAVARNPVMMTRPITTDVRSKIIDLKRKKMGDAREQLGKLAQKVDARSKLSNQKPSMKMPTGPPAKPQDMRQKLMQKNAQAKKPVQRVTASRLGAQPKGTPAVNRAQAAVNNARNKLGRTARAPPAAKLMSRQQSVKQVTVNRPRYQEPVRQAPVKRYVEPQQAPPRRQVQRQVQTAPPPRRQVVRQRPVVVVQEPVYEEPIEYVDEFDGQEELEPIYVDTAGNEIIYEEPAPVYQQPMRRVVQRQQPMNMNNGYSMQQQPQQVRYAVQQQRPMNNYVEQQPMDNGYMQQQNNGYMQPQQQYMNNGMYQQQPMQRQQPMQQRQQPMQRQPMAPYQQPQQYQQQSSPVSRMSYQQQQQRAVQNNASGRFQQQSRPVRNAPAPARSHVQQRTQQPSRSSRAAPAPVRTVQKAPARIEQRQVKVKQSPLPASSRISGPAGSSKVVGTRVSVTNLHDVATADDIEELFENIGTVSSARMISKGSVIVTFKTNPDAKKAVEVYHNRKLDGQPMQVKIVGPVYEK